MKKIKRLIRNPFRVFLPFLFKLTPYIKNDELFLRLRYLFETGSFLHLNPPNTFNEKIQWLKLYDRNPLYTTMVDKYKVKKYVSNLVGKEYVAKTYGVWDSPNEIDFSQLPDKFVLKTTHGGGNNGVYICLEKNSLEISKVKAIFEKAMTLNIYDTSKEWPYKNVKKRIFAEEYLEDDQTKELRDYKFFCFNGKVKMLFVATDRQKREEPFFNFFDRNYSELELQQGHPRKSSPPEKPQRFEEMILLAEQLAQGIPHVRVDLYEVNGKIYFGEYTFYHFGGFVPFSPKKWDSVLGKHINLPINK